MVSIEFSNVDIGFVQMLQNEGDILKQLLFLYSELIEIKMKIAYHLTVFCDIIFSNYAQKEV